jgi:hypothetical protein
VQCFYIDVPDNKRPNACPTSIYDNIILNRHALCPARLVLCILPVVIVLQGYSARRDRIDRDTREGSLMRPIWRGCRWRCWAMSGGRLLLLGGWRGRVEAEFSCTGSIAGHAVIAGS